MAESAFDRRVAAVRRFNRFYTRKIGILDQSYLGSGLSLSEVRVLYELAFRDGPTASELCRDLGLDAGYLSRILKRFEENGLVEREPSPQDARQSLLRLTADGEAAFAPLYHRSQQEIGALLAPLRTEEQERLVNAIETIESLLGAEPERPVPYLLRPHQPGDMGWVVQAHGRIYAEEYGWDETFEALVAGIVAQFIQTFDARRERCWIAERQGENVGSVFVVRQSDEVAKLRLLIVAPGARGLGIGQRLVSECIRFARRSGYRKITLWTNDVLAAARQIYEAADFRLVASEPHHSFGHDLVGETWELELR